MTKYAISVFNYVVIVIRYARYATRSECVALPAPVAYLQPQQANLLTCAKRPPCDTVTDSNKSLLREKFTRNSVHGGRTCSGHRCHHAYSAQHILAALCSMMGSIVKTES